MPATAIEVAHVNSGYRASTGKDGSLTIHRIPIFCVCKRGEANFDDRWLAQAVASAKQAERDNYLPPLHVRHHEPSTETNDSVRPAGFFRILGSETINLKGARRTAIMADLIITDPAVKHEILARRLPYRSVEIFDFEKPNIDSLALLDHEAPFLELPMGFVSQIEEQDEEGDDGGFGDVASATFGRGWTMDTLKREDPVLAFCRSGRSVHLLFREEDPMAETETKTETFGAGVTDGHIVTTTTADTSGEGPLIFADDEPKKDDDKSEDMEGGGDEVEAAAKLVAGAIKSGKISMNALDAIVAAMAEQKSDVVEDDPAAPAPAAAPGEAMKREPSSEAAQLASLQGEVIAMKADRKSRDEADVRTKDVAAAMKRLEDRPLGSLEKLEEGFIAFHKASGPELFKIHVDSIEKAAGVAPEREGFDEDFAAAYPEAVLKFQRQGPGAIERAVGFASNWEKLRAHGVVNMTQERYVEVNMQEVLN